ncbi:MAG: GGDEF domain-containing protein, partial [Actinomycetota bacterium]
QAIAAAIEPRLDELVPRLRAWAQLVLGSIARRFGELTVAVAHLDAALPVLIGIGDEHRIVRAYSERAEAKAALGDTAGAFVDARACTRYVRRNQLDLVGQLSVQIRQRADLEIARAALRRRADDLAQEAAVDALTGVGSRRWMERLLDRLGSQGGQGAVVLVDLDHFKSVNDRFGHHAGDLTLQAVGRILRDSVRDGDHVARLGGEEFVIIAPGTPAEVATQLAERIRTEIEAAPWHEIDPELRVTASAGVAHGPLASVREVIRVADAALYDAKRAGRNRVAAA